MKRLAKIRSKIRKTQATTMLFAIVLMCLYLFASPTFAQADGFTQADRDRMIRMEAILEQHEKRFETIDRRFETVDKRFEELRTDLNMQITELRADMNTQMSELRADMRNIILLFGSLVAAIIGFAVWDRRTMIRPFETKVKSIDSAIEQLKEEKTAHKIITALRELAKTDMKLAEVLKSHHLL